MFKTSFFREKEVFVLYHILGPNYAGGFEQLEALDFDIFNMIIRPKTVQLYEELKTKENSVSLKEKVLFVLSIKNMVVGQSN